MPIDDESLVPPARPSPEVLAVVNEVGRIANQDLDLRSMLQRITDTLARCFDWEHVACVRVDRTHERFVCEALTSSAPCDVRVGYGRPLGSGVVGEVAATGRSILLDDVRQHDNYVETVPGARSELCVPIKHGGEVVAILNLESRRAGAFHDQLAMVETVAEQVAGAIANARLYEALGERAAALQMLSEVSRTALEAGDLDALLRRIVHYVQTKFGLTIVAICLLDDDHTGWELRAWTGSTPLDIPLGGRYPLDVGIVGRTIRSGEAELVLDVAADPSYLPGSRDVRAELAVPIRFRGATLGALNFESRDPELFSPHIIGVLEMLADQVAGAIHLASLNRELGETARRLQEANATLELLSSMDGLTGVANRRRFDEVLEVEWRRAQRSSEPLSLILLDIDCFKPFNDAYGHQQGDDCLKAVARVLDSSVQRASDLVARYGGEEFAVVLPGVAAQPAFELAEMLRTRVAGLSIAHAQSTVAPRVTLSAGVATRHPDLGGSTAELLAAADEALYSAKGAGRNRVVAAVAEADEPR
jgi:diguanylate cyclase (GGDEF)-like protein